MSLIIVHEKRNCTADLHTFILQTESMRDFARNMFKIAPRMNFTALKKEKGKQFV